MTKGFKIYQIAQV